MIYKQTNKQESSTYQLVQLLSSIAQGRYQHVTMWLSFLRCRGDGIPSLTCGVCLSSSDTCLAACQTEDARDRQKQLASDRSGSRQTADAHESCLERTPMLDSRSSRVALDNRRRQQKLMSGVRHKTLESNRSSSCQTEADHDRQQTLMLDSRSSRVASDRRRSR